MYLGARERLFEKTFTQHRSLREKYFYQSERNSVYTLLSHYFKRTSQYLYRSRKSEKFV